MATPIQGPLEPTEAPAPDSEPLWPAWYAFVGLLVGLIGTVMLIGTFAAIFGLTDEESAEFVVIGTVIQGGVFVGYGDRCSRAWSGRPRLWHFGLTGGRPFWPTSPGRPPAWCLLRLRGRLLRGRRPGYRADGHPGPRGRPGHARADHRRRIIVIVVAPVVEEFFFRGFFYKALRTGLSMVPAAVVDGVLFGLIHYTVDRIRSRSCPRSRSWASSSASSTRRPARSSRRSRCTPSTTPSPTRPRPTTGGWSRSWPDR